MTSNGFQPSAYQQAIFDFVKDDDGHGIVQACAGSGKTTTNIKALKYVKSGSDSIFLAFNRHIANELSSRGVECASTFHSLGKAAIIATLPKARFDQYKNYNILDGIGRISYDNKAIVNRIIGLLKGNLLRPSMDNALNIINEFSSIHVDWDDQEYIAELSIDVMRAGIRDHNTYDFDDMIYWPATDKVSPMPADFVFVDEAQDLNKAQIQMAEKISQQRMLLIGDQNQSIYAFRGAFVGIMDYMQDRLQATSLPLSISYRAPKVVVKLVNQLFSYITFEPSPNAIEGSFQDISISEFLELVQPGDGIICRTNAPLVEPCFALIRKGIKATILGRDIGKGLIGLVNKRAKLNRTQNLDDLIRELRTYFNNERRKLDAANKQAKIATLEDQIETIIAISEDCPTIQELKDKIQATFSDNSAGIVFSSVHKAKGLEWDRVFILRPNLMPHPMAKSDTDKQQENNIKYVAITRTKQDLYYVYGE